MSSTHMGLFLGRRCDKIEDRCSLVDTNFRGLNQSSLRIAKYLYRYPELYAMKY